MTGYSSIVLQHFHRPANVGEAAFPDGVGEASTDDRIAMRFSVAVRDGRLGDVRFRSSSCVVAVAACSALTQMAHELTLQQARALSPIDLEAALEEVPDHRRDRCAAAITALNAALDDYESNAIRTIPTLLEAKT